MGENKGHGIKGPRHDKDVDELGIGAGSAGQQGQDSMQSDRQQGAGGIAEPNEAGSQQGEPARSNSQKWSQGKSIDKQRGNR